MQSEIAKAQSLKKVIDGGGQGVNDNGEVDLTKVWPRRPRGGSRQQEKV